MFRIRPPYSGRAETDLHTPGGVDSGSYTAGMAETVGTKGDSYRAVEILFNPWNTGRTTVNILTVDYHGDRRVARRIGTVGLRLGRCDLVGLTPGEVTWLLVDRLHQWLSEERSTLSGPSLPAPGRRAAPAPPEGVAGAAVDPLRTHTLPGL